MVLLHLTPLPLTPLPVTWPSLAPLVGALPSWTPLALAGLMMVALVLLWLSMRRHIRIARSDAPDDSVDAGTVIAHREQAEDPSGPAAPGASLPDERDPRA
ncbi:hypothetical protein [Propioniciclava soli]|uniref:hypothetical protein n=1 Tax=Propioniciclava soli TaxID=2775081 RepID=UPI001E4605A8|nr:hypothetical protein [Propioniciclava soli]